jgi:integrase
MSIITRPARCREIPAFDLYDLSTAAVLPPPPPTPPAIALDMADEPPRGFGPIPFDKFVDELRQNYTIGSKATWQKLEYVLRSLKAMGVTSTQDLTVPLVARYVTSRPPDQSPFTLASLLSSLRAACTYAHAQGYVRINPFTVKKLGKWVRLTRPEETNHLSRDQIKRILDRMVLDIAERTEWSQWRARRIYVLTAIIAFCALRRNEARRLHVADIDLVGRVIYIVPRVRLKTSRSGAPVPMPEALVPIVEDWLLHRRDAPPGVVVPDSPWLIPTVGRNKAWLHGTCGTRALDVMKDAAERAGVKGATFQALRRSWATHAEYHGLGPALIARVLRHSERVDAQFYRKADLPNLTERVKGMTF